MSKRIHIVIIDSSAIIRRGVASILQLDSFLSANCDIAEAADLTTALSSESRNRLTPDILIVNPSQVGVSPSLTQLRSDFGNDSLRVIALQSAYIDPNLLQSYDGAISIYDSAEGVIKKIADLINSRNEEESDSRKELSLREKEIIVCVVKGMTNKQTADTLCLSTHTVIAHRRNIASKLQIHSPAGLTIYAIVNKLVDLSEIQNSISSTKEE